MPISLYSYFLSHSPIARTAYNNTQGRSIDERPFELKERLYGNWEMDTVVGKQGSKSALLVLTERV